MDAAQTTDAMPLNWRQITASWRCRIFGHKHKRLGFGVVYADPGQCYRCGDSNMYPEGEGSLWCKIFGHKFKLTLEGDFGRDKWDSEMCFHCHLPSATGERRLKKAQKQSPAH